jgi:hypothetical protein
MAWIRCSTCEIEFEDTKQQPKCPHLTGSERPRIMARQSPSKPFPAMFNSDCGGGDEIEEGEEIVMWFGQPYHNDEDCCRGLRQPVQDELKDRWA